MAEDDNDKNTREWISLTRSAIINELKLERKNELFTDIDIAVRVVRALIIVIEDIWSRCCQYYVGGGNFKTMRFDEVIVGNVSPGIVTISIVNNPMSKKFLLEPLRELPPCLRILEPMRDHAGFIDFKSLLRTSLIFNEDVLSSFLARLKEHLENIQVLLGEIDEWAKHTANNIIFLETTFGMTKEDITSAAVVPTYCTCQRQGPYVCRPCAGKKEYIIRQFLLPGKLEQSFNISQVKDRERLMKLLEFLSHY